MRTSVEPSPGPRQPGLIGRSAECSELDQLIADVHAGQSRALVLHGEPGVGKTVLLDHVAAHAPGTRVIRVGGVQAEMELPFAGLHQLCRPLLDRLDRLPEPKADALRVTFGMSAGPVPARVLVGLAVLDLLSDAAADQPLVLLVDDHHWLDLPSARALALVARRLGAESVALVLTTRDVGDDLAGLPGLAVDGLSPADAGALLDTVLSSPIDRRIREQIVAETGGNPLALLELPRGLAPTELAGGFGFPGAVNLSGSIERTFGRRADALPAAARQYLLVAASDPSGDAILVDHAAARLGIPHDAAAATVESGLLEMRARVWFRHPLVRSAIYRSASAADRRRVHRALAEVTDVRFDPDRRAWHMAQATAGPDDAVAAELERSADRARARGGAAAAAAFLLSSATLTIDPVARADRAVAAAEAQVQAGSFAAALDLLDMAEAGPLTGLQRARAALVRAHLAFVMNRGSDAAPLLLEAAGRLAPIDPSLARATYLDALSAAIIADRLAGPDGDVLTIAQATGAAPPAAGRPGPQDLLLDGLTSVYTRGYEAGLPLLRQALARFGTDLSGADELHWSWLAGITAMELCLDDRWDALSARHVEIARGTGSLSELPLALTLRALFLLFSGDLRAAGGLADEAQALRQATGTHLAPYARLALAAFRGEESTTTDLLRHTIDDVTRRGEGVGIVMAEWATAILYNGLGRYADAAAAAQRSIGPDPDRASLALPLVELIEAAVRTGDVRTAEDAYQHLSAVMAASGTDWALGLRARSQALLDSGDDAERGYREALAHLGHTRLRVDHVRVTLLYGEWLRRERRYVEAREHLHEARSAFESMGMVAFAERARRELQAAGVTVHRKVDAPVPGGLTPQEAQIAQMARDGLSNPEIAGRLFISTHTVQYHLRKVFTKLDISSRGQLDLVLSVPGNPVSR